jgi:hypothetical protein
VGWVALFSIAAGLIYGAWVDGANRGFLVLGTLGFVATLAVTVNWLHGRVDARGRAT